MIPTDTDQIDFAGYPEELSRRLISELRKKLKMTQAQFGELVTLHLQTVSKLERGELKMEEQLLPKCLMLREVLAVPGAAECIRYVTLERNGLDAWYLAQTIYRSIA